MTRRVILVLCCLAAITAFAQKKDDKKNQSETTTFKSVVNIVDFELVALDKSGNAVTDLKPEEITILQDDKPRPLKTMDLVNGQKDKSASEYGLAIKQTLAKLPPNIKTNMTALPTLMNQPVYTILLIDTLNTPSDVKSQARRKMIDMLNTLDSSQPIAIYGLNNSLVLLQDFTTNRDILKKAIQEAHGTGQTEHKDGKIIDRTTSNTVVAGLEGTPADGGAQYNIQPVVENIRAMENQLAVAQLDFRIQTTSQALQAIARRLQGIPGRKNLVWLTAMFPEYIFPEPEFGKDTSRTDRFDKLPVWYKAIMDQNALVLQDAHISVYPVDASGLQNRTWSVDSDQHVDNLFTKYVPGQTGSSVPSANIESAERHTSMERIANLTGGRAFHDRNDLDKAVQIAINEGNTYYSVSFPPAEQYADGKVHSLKVTTTRKGVTLRHRTTFLEYDQGYRGAEQRKAIVSTVHFAMLEQPSLSTGVIAFVSKADAPGVLNVSIDPRTISLAQEPNGSFRLLVQAWAMAFDGSGKFLKDAVTDRGIDMPLDEKQKNTLMTYGLKFQIREPEVKNAKRIRIGVCDFNTGRVGTVDLTLE